MTAADSPTFSVIIPLHRDSDAFRRCLAGTLALDHRSFEVIVVCDSPVKVPSSVRLVETGSSVDSGPGQKRDVGMHAAKGRYFAFIDDDAVPRADWLSRGEEILEEHGVGAVAGPGLTPPASTWRERAGGAFYESWLGSGPYRYRFRPGRARDVDDYPAYNFIVRRSAAEHVKGWGTGFYGGEDTVICLALVEAGWQIRYDPSVVVYHERRPVFGKHLAQVGNVGRHRGYFVKAYPKTSLRPSYFLPTAGTIAVVGLAAAALLDRRARKLLGGAAAAYLSAGVAVGLVEQDDLSVAVVLPIVALVSHLTYGVQFLRGLFTGRLER